MYLLLHKVLVIRQRWWKLCIGRVMNFDLEYNFTLVWVGKSFPNTIQITLRVKTFIFFFKFYLFRIVKYLFKRVGCKV